MEKLKMESVDMTEKNIERIGALFPNIITEMHDENGNLKKGINFELLKQELSGDVVDGEECYDFTWVGKKAAIVEGNKPIRKTLRPCMEESKDWENTGNLYIEGDNLDVLKLLQESYLNSVKMIYIDPPYNTGKDFIYKDKYTIDKDDYDEQIGLYDEDENRLFQNSETNGRFHSDWCSMMHSRLKHVSNLLSEDGVIFISISDAEFMNLKKMCDEIFGPSNFLATLIWDRNHSAQAGVFKVYHEYVLVYCKNSVFINTPKSLDSNLFEAGAMKKESGRHSMQSFKFPKGTRFDASDGVELKNEWGDVEKVILREGRMISENGYLKEDIVLEAAFTQVNQMQQYFYGDKDSLVDSRGQKVVEFYFSSAGKIKVIKKRGVEAPQTTLKYGSQGPISVELAKLFEVESSPFDSPKPVKMIRDFIARFTEPNSSDIILDFFSGSATAAHATFEINSEDRGNRKFILVQCQENLKESLRHASSDARKTIETAIQFLVANNMPPYVTEIGKERIRRAGEKIKSEVNESNKQLKLGEQPKKVPDIGFRVLKVDSSNMKDVYYAANEYSQSMIANLESNIKEDRNDLDLLYGVLLDWGLPLSLNHKIEEIDGVSVHTVDEGSLVACFAERVSESIVREIAKRQPLRVVFRDSSFTNSPDKINVEEIFKLLAPNTTVKVI